MSKLFDDPAWRQGWRVVSKREKHFTNAQLVDKLADWTMKTNPKLYAGHRADACAYWRNTCETRRYFLLAAQQHGLITDAEFRANDKPRSRRR